MRRLLLFAATLVFATVPLSGATIVLPSDERLVEKADRIVVGRVVASEAVDREGSIWTETTIAIEQTLKGAGAASLTIHEIGGRVGDRFTVLFGAPAYHPGERVLAFLARTSEDEWRTVDLAVGKFGEVWRNGEPVWVRDLDSAHIELIEASADAAPLRAGDFADWVRLRAAGLPAPAPVGRSRSEATASVRSEFTLIAPPAIYRWFAFDDGETVSWRSVGSQPGYANGGVGELQTGMSVWNAYSSANIRYGYAGASGGSGGGLSSPNGVNEILFNDPKAEIAGSWNGSDGVLAAGGFNGVTGPRTWTAPFASAGFAAGNHQAHVILEGNLVVQDGVSSSKGISSAMFAEVLAHEFGHTLGFGHSADPTALMYASLQSIGAFLRSDDQLAARWLYPSTGQGPTTPPPVPAAPTELAVSALAPDNVQIRWKDNATNETSQTIYVRPPGGAFAKFSEVGANVTTANLTLEGGKTYSIYLAARNATGESQPSNTIEAAVPLPPLEAAFSVAPATGTAGITTFSFYDQSKGRIASRQWSFGDASGSSLTNPTHLYQQPGSFQVRLTIRGIDGKESVAQRTLDVAAPPLFVADFTWEPVQVLAGEAAGFRDQSAGSPTSWSWSFGDGTTSTERNPAKTFAAPGVYRVSLTIDNGLQISRADRDVIVIAGVGAEPPVQAEFETSSLQPTAGQHVHFTDRSTGDPTSWSWDFGDGTKSTQQHPSHLFDTAGTYLITLVAARGGVSSTRARMFHVRAPSEAFRAIVPAAAQTPGAGGSEWRTDLTLHNAGAEAADVTIHYLPDPGSPALTRSVTVPAKATASWSHALQSLFGLSSGRGALTIEAKSITETPELHVASRTYTASGGATYGQFVPALPPAETGSPLWLTGFESTAAFRTNIGWTNPTDRVVRAQMRLWDASGADLGTRSLDLAPASFGQVPLATIFEFLATQEKSGLTLRITPNAPGVVAYASLVDQRTNDPTFLLARPLPQGARAILPAVAKTPGASGTFWRSDLAIFNPGSTLMQIRIRLLESGLDNRFAGWKSLDLSPSRAVSIPDVFEWLGRGTGTGALEIAWNESGPGPVITSRTFTTRASDGGTFGQSVGSIDPAAPATSYVVTGVRSDAAFRANVGFVSWAESTSGVSVQAVASNGEPLAEALISLPPRSHLQMPLATLFPGLANAESIGEVTLVARPVGSPAVLIYGSVVDRSSGDPIFIAR